MKVIIQKVDLQELKIDLSNSNINLRQFKSILESLNKYYLRECKRYKSMDKVILRLNDNPKVLNFESM